ncbi:hypothetical protein [Streptomyces mangrovisoli]|uniref:Uncharacterized protein n=1 Tax=Streptomyces mangrovisoli TaxID=1428628 RepID=A0A1J4NXM2_9ACTN|nr:hypothetical protein [Streptomyces mangrovisoli]OIJ67099.1 hypothetical protein WN71_014885 [Streptomyces mangrovisoli]
MSTEPRKGGAPGALLLCRADPDSVAAAAQLLREPLMLTGAGPEWSLLVPEGTPWLHGDEQVDRVATGWAAALAVSAPWPVLALWWDADRAGYSLAAGFRRPVGYIWLADGTPVGEDEAMLTFATRLGLDPVLDAQALQQLTKPAAAPGPAAVAVPLPGAAPGADGGARLRALLAVLGRTGLDLPAGLAPGEGADRLYARASALPGARPVRWPGLREAIRAELTAPEPAPRTPLGRLATWLPPAGTPQARALALAQLVAGLPIAVRGLRRRSVGWTVAGALLLAHGALGLTYDLVRPLD